MSMAQPDTQPALGAIVGNVLGDMAFLVSDDDGAACDHDGTWLTGAIRYRGPMNGRIKCWFTAQLAAELAANLLGLEPNSAQAQQDAGDAVGEFMNVLCGQLVTTWFDRSAIFDLSIPEVSKTSQAPADAEPGGQHACLTVSGQPLHCWHVTD